MLINLLFIEIYCYNQESLRDGLVILGLSTKTREQTKRVTAPQFTLWALNLNVCDSHLGGHFLTSPDVCFLTYVPGMSLRPGDTVVNKRDEILAFLQHQF